MKHFYKHENGIWIPCHTVPYADPSKGMRDTTLGDARKLGLVPSVMGIIGVINAPSINNYRVDQAIKSALTLPRLLEDADGYSGRCIRDLGSEAFNAYAVAKWCHRNPPRPLLTEDEHAQRVLIDAEAASERAKELGSAIHDIISDGLKHPNEPWKIFVSGTNKTILDSRELARLQAEELAGPAMHWLDENLEEIYAVEQIVGSLEHGYAGTLDLDADIKGIGRCIIDFKSQPVKRNGTGPKPAFYFSYGKQLAAYAYAAASDNHNRSLVSVIIDKANEGEVFVKVWDNQFELWRQFLNNCEAWRFENQFDPRVQS